jgi:hypothetical protein
MWTRPLPTSRSLAGLLVFTGACSIFTDLSDLTGGTVSGATSTGGAAGATSTVGKGGASTSSASSGSSTGSSGTGCSAPGEIRDTSTSHCYFKQGGVLRFDDARTACKAWDPGADLIVIESQEEAGFVLNTVAVEKDTWIGLSDLVTPGTYQWVNNTPLASTPYTPPWETGFPSDASGNCIGYNYELKWQNASCSSTENTVCERP